MLQRRLRPRPDRSSDAHERPDLLELGRSDAGYIVEVVDRPEGTVLVAVGHDRRRCRGPHPRKRLELPGGSRIQIDRG